MKCFRFLRILYILFMIFVACYFSSALGESALKLPSNLSVIEQEAFRGTGEIEIVELPLSLQEIHSLAFANCSIDVIHFPASISFIADDAFMGSTLNHVTAVKDSYAYNWAVAHHFISKDCDVVASITNSVAMINPGRFHPIGESASIEGLVTSNLPISRIYGYIAQVTDSNGAYEVIASTVDNLKSPVFTYDLSSSRKIKQLNFSILSCGKYILFLGCSIPNQASYVFYRQDFEVVKPCEDIVLPDSVTNLLEIECYQSTRIQMSSLPEDATYADTFFFLSSNADCIMTGEDGLLEARGEGIATVTVYSGDYLVKKEFSVKVTPVAVDVIVDITDNAGFDNDYHYHTYRTSHRFAGTIQSSIAIRKVYADVVYRGGPNDGAEAYNCDNTAVICDDGVYSIDIRPSKLNQYLKFNEMPCAPLTMHLYAELANGNTYTIYTYDFEILKQCTSVSLNYSEKKMKYTSAFQLIPMVAPSDATYVNTLYYSSSNPSVASVDEYGVVRSGNKAGYATISVSSGDQLVKAYCSVTVDNSIPDTPQITGYLVGGTLYDSNYDRTIYVNVSSVQNASSYEVYRALSPNGPYKCWMRGDGTAPEEYWSNPFPSGLVFCDAECDENTVYYYKARSQKANGTYSDFSDVYSVNSGYSEIIPPLWIDIQDLSMYNIVTGNLGKYLSISGTVKANYPMSEVTVDVVSRWGTLIKKISRPVNGYTFSLADLMLDTSDLANGGYKLVLSATANGVTEVVTNLIFTVNRAVSVLQSTETLRQDIAVFASQNSASIFYPCNEVNDFFNHMNTSDIIAMGLSDFSSITASTMKDLLSGSDYNSYMKAKYEALIIQILDGMFKEGKVEEIEMPSWMKQLINSMEGLVKNGSECRIQEINDVFMQNMNNVDWDKLNNLVIIKDKCSEFSKKYGNIKTGLEYINIICELFADHTKDLMALELIEEVYNPNCDPAFTAALEDIRSSYSMRFGSSLRMWFEKMEKELDKTIEKEITSAILSASVSSFYSLAKTVAETTLYITGVTNAGKARVDFITQYNTLAILRQAYGRVRDEIVLCTNAGQLPTDSQIDQLQVTFASAKQAMIILTETMKKLDPDNEETYIGYVVNIEEMTMPGLERLYQ